MTRCASCILAIFTFIIFIPTHSLAGAPNPARVLILVEGKTTLHTYAVGDGRQLATLLGHFNTATTVLGVDDYAPGSVARYDHVFYVGFSARNNVPETFIADLLHTDVPIVWVHTGFAEFSATHDVRGRFGFSVSGIDSLEGYDQIVTGDKSFTKEEPNINMIRISDASRVDVLATAISSRTRHTTPYIVRSGHLTYVTDSPFSIISSTDRYLLFADMLHDILNQPHEESHTALIRIEDVNPMEDPGHLRDIADLLSGRGIPFLVSVTPFYVNPGEGLRVSLSDRPEIVDALKYMVRNGGTIVMHGTTHQSTGVTAADFEFWDPSTNRPLKDETAEAFTRRIEMGLQEFMQNGLCPLAWETPHYAGSFLLYETVAKYFSTAIEQRLAIEDFAYGQYVPYIIQKDLFGQRLYPENLGYVPLESDQAKNQACIHGLITAAKANLQVRDGFASCFFHAFVDVGLLRQLVDGIQALGYTYMDLREQSNWVRMNDRVILTGSQDYSIALHDQYLQESYFDPNAELVRTSVSDRRLTGSITRAIALKAGEVYKAEPTEFRERRRGVLENAALGVTRLRERLFKSDDAWKEAKPVILWNHRARGAAYNDQASFAAVLRSVNIALDTIFVGQPVSLAPYNLVIVPFSFVESMEQRDFDAVVKFVENGGYLITDTRNYLADELGITFRKTTLNINRPLDRCFPDERLLWRYPEPLVKFECDEVDEIFCVDDATKAPLVVGKPLGKGRVIFFGTRFDPHSQLGYSQYPFLLEYIRRYFRIGPIIRRENLEMYFDPGFRHTQSVEDLVKLWVKHGVRRIHVAGWHQYPKYNYDYARLLRLAHAHGILVYAWLEPPQVSHKFWSSHPEWREKNVKGEDVRPSWRYPVALTDDACVTAMRDEYCVFLEKYDWDGVNLAELYFEAGRGFDDPVLWSPMHPSAKRDFQQLHGIALPSIFDPQSRSFWKANRGVRETVVQYRVDKLNGVYERLLDAFARIASRRPGFQVIVTAMDSYGSPELREQIGVDMKEILRLQRHYGFLLQVEDPERLWSTDPMRYVAIGSNYKQMLGDSAKCLLDLNILSFRRPDQVTPFPTMMPRGTETCLLVNAASVGAHRATIYAESSVHPEDMQFLAYATAVATQYQRAGRQYLITSPVSFTLRLPPEVREISLNGMHLTPTRGNLFTIPAGRHSVVVSPDLTPELSGHQIEPRIMSFSGTLLSASYGMRSIHFAYEADGRALVSIDRVPVSVKVDGNNYDVTPMKGSDCYSMFLPPGRHSVDVVAGGSFSSGINVASFWSSTGIALFGLVAVTALLAMYALWAVQRRRIASARN